MPGVDLEIPTYVFDAVFDENLTDPADLERISYVAMYFAFASVLYC
jgi:hypothetical protein